MVNANKFRLAWLALIVMACGVMLAGTLLSIREINLRAESNLAALWSGLLLLLIGIHAFDGYASNRQESPTIARAWLVITAIMVLLSFDEVGSLHERLPADSHMTYWLWIAPFALGFAAMGLYALCVLYRSVEHQGAAILIMIGFLLFVSVAVQEELEWRFEVSDQMKPIRGAIEEGTELLGMFLILLASMRNTRGRLSTTTSDSEPVFEAGRAWRMPVLTVGLAFTPLIAYFTTQLPDDGWGHGLPAQWPPAAIFLLAGLVAIRPYFQGAQRPSWSAAAAVVLCMAGCVMATRDTGSSQWLIGLSAIAGLSVLAWLFDGGKPRRAVLFGGAFVTVCLGLAWAFAENAIVQFTLIAYIALGFYYVLGSRSAAPVTDAPG